MISRKELMVLACLRKNARQPLVEMAGQTGMSVSNVHSIMRKIASHGISKNYCELDFGMAGYPIRLCYIVQIGSNKGTNENLGELLNARPDLLKHVNNVFRLNNGTNYFIEAIFREMREAYAFSELLQQVSKTFAEHHVIEVIKKEGFELPLKSE